MLMELVMEKTTEVPEKTSEVPYFKSKCKLECYSVLHKTKMHKFVCFCSTTVHKGHKE